MTSPRVWRKNGILARDKRRIRRAELAIQITNLSASGSTAKAVAQQLGISDDTVRSRLNSAMCRVTELTPNEREKLARMPAPAPPGSPRWRALQLRLGGATYGQIAAALDAPVTSVKRWIRQELERLEALELTNANLLRRMELLRLEALGAAAWPGAVQGDLASTNRYLRIQDRRARLLGLYASPLTRSGLFLTA